MAKKFIIEIRCLECKSVFDKKVNGVRLRYSEKDNSIIDGTEKIKCKCGSETVVLDYYYNVKLKYPK